MSRVVWTDVSPRDGLQNIPEQVEVQDRIELVRGLLEAGLPRVEAGAFVSSKWVPQMAGSEDVFAAFGVAERARLRALIPNQQGLDRAQEAGITNVLFTIAATDTFNKKNVNRSVAESLSELALMAAESQGVTIDVALSVAFGCPFEGRVESRVVVDLCQQLADLGVSEIGIADTIGVATPAAVRRLCGEVSSVVPLERLSLHVHDTRGQGVANVVAAYETGITNFDGSAGGVGGCPFAPRATGNVCSEDALEALHSLGAETGVNLEAVCRVSERLAQTLGRDLPGKLYRAGIWSGEAN